MGCSPHLVHTYSLFHLHQLGSQSCCHKDQWLPLRNLCFHRQKYVDALKFCAISLEQHRFLLTYSLPNLEAICIRTRWSIWCKPNTFQIYQNILLGKLFGQLRTKIEDSLLHRSQVACAHLTENGISSWPVWNENKFLPKQHNTSQRFVFFVHDLKELASRCLVCYKGCVSAIFVYISLLSSKDLPDQKGT